MPVRNVPAPSLMMFVVCHSFPVNLPGRNERAIQTGERGLVALGNTRRTYRDIQLVKLGLLAATRAFRHSWPPGHFAAPTLKMEIHWAPLQEGRNSNGIRSSMSLEELNFSFMPLSCFPRAEGS